MSNFKKIILILIFQTISFSSLKCDFFEKKDNSYSYDLSYIKIANPKIYRSYLLADNDKILIEDNIDEMLPLASLTKIMTAMVVLDNVKDLNEIVRINKEVSKVPYGTRIKENEEYTVYELLNLLLITSTNAAAKALADYVSPEFITLMNEKAKEIGANDVRYCTPHGLPTRYTNACMDMASARTLYKISKYAIDNYPVIREIVSKKTETIQNHKLKNTNPELKSNENVKGLKTGFHNEAKYNISIYYNDNKKELFEIILGSDSVFDRSLISEKVLKQFGGNK